MDKKEEMVWHLAVAVAIIVVITLLGVSSITTSLPPAENDTVENITNSTGPVEVIENITEPPIEEVQEPELTAKDLVIQTAREFGRTHAELYIADIYDCTDMSWDLKKLLWDEYKIGSDVMLIEVDCEYQLGGRNFWNIDNCRYFGGLHDILKVWLPDGSTILIESTKGQEIVEELYPAYNMNVRSAT